MKISHWIVAAALTAMCLPSMAQQQPNDPNGQTKTSENGATNGATSKPNANGDAVKDRGQADANAPAAAGTEEMRPVRGELEGQLDARSAKTGDQVAMKTAERVKTADGTEIPEGSRIVGHVTQVQTQQGQADSHVGIAFDRAELSDGRSIPIHSTIQSVASPVGAAAASDDSARDGTGGMATAGGSGGLNGAAGTKGGAKATGVPGVMLRGDATGTASGTLSASGKDVHLDSGTQMVLGVAAARKE